MASGHKPRCSVGISQVGVRGREGVKHLPGGYFAESLAGQGRQAAMISLREISEVYLDHLGLWVVREVARAAMRSPPARYASPGRSDAEMEKRIKTLQGCGVGRPNYWLRRYREARRKF